MLLRILTAVFTVRNKEGWAVRLTKQPFRAGAGSALHPHHVVCPLQHAMPFWSLQPPDLMALHHALELEYLCTVTHTLKLHSHPVTGDTSTKLESQVGAVTPNYHFSILTPSCCGSSPPPLWEMKDTTPLSFRTAVDS